MRWEYKTLPAGDETDLNILGANGWELCAIEYSADRPNTFWLKRPKILREPKREATTNEGDGTCA